MKDFESKCLHLSVPSFRMLEDDLKLSSDDEESEQVRFSWVLLSCTRCLDEGKLSHRDSEPSGCVILDIVLPLKSLCASLLKCLELCSH